MDTETLTTEPTAANLDAMIRSTHEPRKVKTETPEPTAKAKEEHTEPESGTGKTKQQEEIEEELPEGAKKRIAKEVERTSRAQAAIDKAISERKAKEAEAATFTGKTGSEPAKTTEPVKKETREEPDLATFEGTLAEYKQAMKEFRAWEREQIENSVRETVSKELTERQAKEVQRKEWEKATEKYGAEFPKLMDTLAANSPVGLQRAISELDDWDSVAVHLAKNEEELSILVEEFKSRPARAIANLGKLEDRLTSDAKTNPKEEKVEKPLPKPLKPIGGDAGGRTARPDLEKSSFREAASVFDRAFKSK